MRYTSRTFYSHILTDLFAFIPYLYTMSWHDHNKAVSPFRPIYHIEPESKTAYHNPDVYTFGSELIAAPFTGPANNQTQLSRKQIWLPKGDWFNFFTGEFLSAGHQTIYGSLEDIPVFAKAGAIVPVAPLPAWGGIENPSHLRVHIFPGADNRFELYEDDGKTIRAYLSREDVANLSNMTTSNGIRTLSNLVSEGIIEMQGRKIRILENNHLEHISELG